MNIVFELLGFEDIKFIEDKSLTRIRGISEITGQTWELPLWEIELGKINFYRYPELEEFYKEHNNVAV